MIAALFIETGGIYSTLPDVEAWGVERDAKSYSGPLPVVAHPPCQLWGALAHVNYKRYGGEHNRPGNDGGLFVSALTSVRRWSGVLEHPAFTKAWAAYGLTKPTRGGWQQVAGNEWVCEIWQSAYGHGARKRTWLYYVSLGGFPPYEMLWERKPGTHQIGRFDVKKPVLSGKAASRTPKLFAEALVCLAGRAGYGR